MYMSNEDFEELKPDIFILDEFHLCGSETWGAWAETLLAVYRDTHDFGVYPLS